jgi:hypothetical protein
MHASRGFRVSYTCGGIIFLPLGKSYVMDPLKLDTSGPYSAQTAFTALHKLLLQAKLSHYLTKSFPAHEALGRTYDAIEGLTDTITEELIGYAGVDPTSLVIGTVQAQGVKEFAKTIMAEALKLEEFAGKNKYCNIENLAQELSGAGAQLMYLSRF